MNKTAINVSLAGFGFIGKIHTIALKNLNLCLDDVPFNVQLDKLFTSQKLDTKAIGFRHITNDFKELGGTDVLDICTPNFLHFEMVKEGIKNGVKNIFCEKPLVGRYEEEKELLQLVEEKQINHQAGFVLRFLPTVIKAKYILDQRLIGDIINFKCHIYHDSYLNINKKVTWKLSKEKSHGGALMDLGIHLVDLIHYLLGPIKQVNGHSETVVKERHGHQVDVDDFSFLDLKLEGNVTGRLEASRVAAGKGEETIVEIFGTKGSIVIEVNKPDAPSLHDYQKGIWQHGNLPMPSDLEAEIRRVYPGYKFSLGGMVNIHMASLYSFLLKIHGHEFKYLGLPDFFDAAKATKVVEAGYKSAESGGTTVFI